MIHIQYSGARFLMAALLISLALPAAAFEVVVLPKNIYDPFAEENRSEFVRTTLGQAGATSFILFFDEADALFGKRASIQDAQERYENVDPNELLDNIEEFVDLTLLASNYLVFSETESEAEVRSLFDNLAARSTDLQALAVSDLWLVPAGGIRASEPATLAILSLGLAGIGLTRRRRLAV